MSAVILSNEALAQSYFDAWNARDAEAILATLGTDGVYSDPGTGGPIKGEALRAYVGGLFAAFPDLSFEVTSHAATGPASAATQWVMRGTNLGSMRGLPPTGKVVEVHGADFFAFGDGYIASVTGYFDGGAVPRQIGLDVIVQPPRIGPFSFGTSTAVRTGRTDVPGAVSLTSLEPRNAAEVERVRDIARRSLMAMLEMEGFLSATTANVGGRMMTISAWTSAEAARKMMAEPNHAEGMRAMYSGELGKSGRTSVWKLERDNGLLQCCEACGKVVRNVQPDTVCGCGATLPAPPPFW